MAKMTNAEAIEAAKNGRRADTEHSLHDKEDTKTSKTCVHNWRAIACNDEEDVIECSKCGMQRLMACDFNEEYA